MKNWDWPMIVLTLVILVVPLLIVGWLGYLKISGAWCGV